ncbi:hypothetical protein BDZ97DRAFT_1904028 [Flammula alnicola]|nr:hypothetical protein BDZ97DRAFT_1904028 [Flammula alnicola]
MFGSQPTCSECFIAAHHAKPTHWAEKWDSDKGFFIRHDISTLRPQGYSIQFGHLGVVCPYTTEENEVFFHIIDCNGIHNTKVRFCGCPGSLDRAKQLLAHGLFPATLARPQMAFTFQLLETFHILHLKSKIAKYDFVGALRRLTDNAFVHNVSDPYPQFRVVTQVWTVLKAMMRLGQCHGIDQILPNRRPGNLIVFCPACPEPGVNMEPGWERTPNHLRHLNQTRFTADGNFHLNHFIKNNDPEEISLFRGNAYFPKDEKFKPYIARVSSDIPEVRGTCHLSVLKNRKEKKFDYMDVSGASQVACSHVIIKSTVDLQLGERFANTDYALAHAIQQHRPVERGTKMNCDHLMSYDIACAYHINIVDRFKKNFPELVADVEAIRWLIPLVHIQNHKDNCTYLHSSAYTPSAGHFHGETAEMPWSESNQLGPQTRQMNNGQRKDVLIDNAGDWNWKKTANMMTTLYNEIIRAKVLADEKREAFKALCELYPGRIETWNNLDRERRVVSKGKEVECVYRHSQKKEPSHTRIYNLLIDELQAKISIGTIAPEMGLIPSFLKDGLSILETKRRITSKLSTQQHGVADPKLNDEISKQRSKLRNQINKWRRVQRKIAPQVGDHVAKQALSFKTLDSTEDENLFLPSDFSLSDRLSLNLIQLSELQRRYFQGYAHNYKDQVRLISKSLSALRVEKKKNAYGQDRHTRAAARISDVEHRLDLAIEDYNATRSALVSLGMSEDDPEFPPLTLKDTFRKRTNTKRAVGDTYRMDGLIWTNTGATGGARASQAASSDGWIWRPTPGTDLTEKELAEWIEEGDRVQWFRAEAEMQRWQEELETLQADFMRCIRTFQKMSEVWKDLAKSNSGEPGKTAYARKKSSMFTEMAIRGQQQFENAGYSNRVLEEGKILADYLEIDRSDLEKSLQHLLVGVSFSVILICS